MERVETILDPTGKRVQMLRVHFSDLDLHLGDHRLLAISVIAAQNRESIRLDWYLDLRDGEVKTEGATFRKATGQSAQAPFVGVEQFVRPSGMAADAPSGPSAETGTLAYFAQCSRSKAIKIGNSVDPAARVRQLASASSSDIILLATLPGGLQKERELQEKFAKYRTQREWFEPSDEILQFIKECV